MIMPVPKRLPVSSRKGPAPTSRPLASRSWMKAWWRSVSSSLLSAIFGAGSTTSLLITQHCSRSLIVAFLPRQEPSDRNIEQGEGSRLRCAGDVPRPEHEFLHIAGAGQLLEVLPGLDQRISQHGILHEPEAERQYELAAK